MIAGIDYSTHAIDVVLLDEDTDAATWHRFGLIGNDAFDRARDVQQHRNFLRFMDEDHGVMAVGIEDPRGFNSGALYRVQGAILACLPTSLLVHPLIPSVWRKTVGLPGNASKDAVAEFANGRRVESNAYTKTIGTLTLTTGAVTLWPQDACDAYLIAMATRTLLVTT